MAVKGKQKEQKDFTKRLFVGFTPVKIVAVNPLREEINQLVGRDGTSDDKEMTYLGEDQEGNDRLRLAFWLQDLHSGELYVNSFNLTNKARRNKDGTKVQIINSTCTTSWAELVMKDDESTDEMNEGSIQPWFDNFTDREGVKLGKKKWRKALSGEEELAILLRSWLGRLNFMDIETEVLVDTKKLFKENYKELRELISLDEKGEFSAEGYDTPFVILLGVKTDENDATKKYQQVWTKGYLPNTFMKYINNGNKFPSDYTKKIFKKFKEEVEGDYGFDGYTELTVLTDYDGGKDITGSSKTAKEVPAPHSSDY